MKKIILFVALLASVSSAHAQSYFCELKALDAKTGTFYKEHALLDKALKTVEFTRPDGSSRSDPAIADAEYKQSGLKQFWTIEAGFPDNYFLGTGSMTWGFVVTPNYQYVLMSINDGLPARMNMACIKS